MTTPIRSSYLNTITSTFNQTTTSLNAFALRTHAFATNFFKSCRPLPAPAFKAAVLIGTSLLLLLFCVRFGIHWTNNSKKDPDTEKATHESRLQREVQRNQKRELFRSNQKAKALIQIQKQEEEKQRVFFKDIDEQLFEPMWKDLTNTVPKKIVEEQESQDAKKREQLESKQHDALPLTRTPADKRFEALRGNTQQMSTLFTSTKEPSTPTQTSPQTSSITGTPFYTPNSTASFTTPINGGGTPYRDALMKTTTPTSRPPFPKEQGASPLPEKLKTPTSNAQNRQPRSTPIKTSNKLPPLSPKTPKTSNGGQQTSPATARRKKNRATGKKWTKILTPAPAPAPSPAP